jgi:hypothetical protein
LPAARRRVGYASPGPAETGLSREGCYEDTVVVTDTGVENFTAFLPAELDAIEAVARGKGILQSLPALTEAGFESLRAGRR